MIFGSGTKKPAPIVLVLALSLILNFTAVWWGLPNSWSWAPDEILPYQVQEGMAAHFSGGWFSKYPLIHYYLLSLLFLPFPALQKWGLIDTNPLAGYSTLLLAARLLSVLMAAGLIYLIYACGREILNRRAGTFAALIVALLVPFPYYAKTVNMEVPYLFWFTGSLYYFIRLLKTGKSRYYGLFALTAALAVCTKDQAYGLFPLPFLLLLWMGWKKIRSAQESKRLLRKKLIGNYSLAFAGAGAAFAVGFNLLFNFSGFVSHLRFIVGPGSEGYQMVSPSLPGYFRLIALTAKQIRFCLGWPLFIVSFCGLAAAFLGKPKNRILLALLLFGLGYFLSFICVIRYTYDRYTLPLCLILSFFGGKALSDFVEGGRAILRTAVVVSVFSSALVSAIAVDRLMLKDSRYAVEAWMRSNIAQGASVLAATPGEYLPRLDAYRHVFLEDPSLPDIDREPKPDYVIFATPFRRSYEASHPGNRFFSKFFERPPGYRLAFRYQTKLALAPLQLDGIGTNLAAINPEILVYEKRDLPPREKNRVGSIKDSPLPFLAQGGLSSRTR